MRRRLGLRISSNAVEKANGLTVAKRQKHQGMSWFYRGSWHFAALTALYLNQEAEVWHKAGSLSFKMTPVSIPKSETSAPAAEQYVTLPVFTAQVENFMAQNLTPEPRRVKALGAASKRTFCHILKSNVHTISRMGRL